MTDADDIAVRGWPRPMPAKLAELLERRGWQPTDKGYGFTPEGAVRPTINAEGTRLHSQLMVVPVTCLGATLDEWEAVRMEISEEFGIEPDALGGAEPEHVPGRVPE